MHKRGFLLGLAILVGVNTLTGCGTVQTNEWKEHSTTEVTQEDVEVVETESSHAENEAESFQEENETEDSQIVEAKQEGSVTGKTSNSNKTSSNTEQSAQKTEDLLLYYQNAHYIEAYRTGNTSKLSGLELTTFQNLKKCIDNAKKYPMKYQQEKAVYDWIILNTAYDTENFQHGTIPMESYCVEGVFGKGVAVCGGYAQSFQLCMDILGIECKTIVNDIHGWNAVKLDDGCWYQVDVTWGDPSPNRPNYISYDYFNITDKEMQKDHKYTPSVSCTATKYNYTNAFTNRTYVGSVDAFYDYVAKAIKAGTTTIKVTVDNVSPIEARDYERMAKLVGKTVPYVVTLEKVSETINGITYDNSYGDKHYIITVQTDKNGDMMEVVQGEDAFWKKVEEEFYAGASTATICMMDSEFEEWAREVSDEKILEVLPYYGAGYVESVKSGGDLHVITVQLFRLGTEKTRAETKEELLQLVEEHFSKGITEIDLFLYRENGTTVDSLDIASFNAQIREICKKYTDKMVYVTYVPGGGEGFRNIFLVELHQ